MERIHQIAIPVEEPSQARKARRAATSLALSLGFNETEAGKVAIVVSEAAGNLANHASDGQLLLRPLEHRGIKGIEILALDNGPGMSNVAECLSDGHSTTGGPGSGLGAISRLSTLFDIHSVPGKGTALLAQLWSRPLPKDLRPHPLDIGAICLPKAGIEVCGDSWAAYQQPHRALILVADGLGHGPQAAEASGEAARLFLENPQLSPQALIEATHLALWRTRGAVLGVAEVDVAHQVVRFAGIGNISGVVLGAGENRHMVSYPGCVGHQVRKIQEFTYPLSRDALLVMHSDGLSGRWSLESFPGLLARHPSLIAGLLYREHSRGRDDVTVVVARVRIGD